MSMMEEKREKWHANKKALTGVIVVLLIAVIGMAFAYYFAILKGDNVNTALTGGASLVYTEPTNGVETIQASDYVGMTNENSYDFSISANASISTRIEYVIYLEEEEGNTVSPSSVRLFLTDENNVPYGGFYSDLAAYDSMKMFVDNDGAISYYDTISDEYDYVITDSTDIEVMSGTVESSTSSPELVLYQFYADSLNLAEGDSLYVKELRYNETEDTEEELCIQYSYDNYGDDADYNIVDDSNCSVLSTYGENGELVLQSTSDFSNMYTMTVDTKELYTNIISDDSDDIIEYSGTIYQYIAEKLNVSAGEKFYLNNSFLTYDDEGNVDYEFSKYCAEYTYVNDDSGAYVNRTGIVENDKCNDAYTVIENMSSPISLGENDGVYVNENLTNVVTHDSFAFDSGVLTSIGKGDVFYTYRNKINPRQFKLRYWISDTTTGGESQEAQEVTPTTDEKSHTVEFGNTGTFKFKVNVYAKQAAL